MATAAPITGAPTGATTFIAQLLAPLPADVAQVDSKGFLRLLKEDSSRAWRRSMHPVLIARARLDYVRAQRLADDQIDETEAFEAYVVEVDRQMAVPTILKEAVAWKRQHVPVGACRDDIERREALIAMDVARMEGR